MDCPQLEKLASNPHYQMSVKQLAALQNCRGSIPIHVQNVTPDDESVIIIKPKVVHDRPKQYTR